MYSRGFFAGVLTLLAIEIAGYGLWCHDPLGLYALLPGVIALALLAG